MKKKFIQPVICLILLTVSAVGLPTVSAAPPQPGQPVPASGSTGVTIFIELQWVCNESGLLYDVHFGNQSPPPLVSSNLTATSYRPAAKLDLDTMYYWQIVARNSQQETSQSPIWSFRTAGDSPPFAPTILNGPPQAGPGIDLEFSTVAPDPEGDDVYYQWDWGDGNLSDWLGPYPFGQRTLTTHNWALNGTYEIRVHARDALGKESPWSSVFPIAISRQIQFKNLLQGYLYFNFWVFFDKTYGYIYSLDQLDMALVISTGELKVEAMGSGTVRTVIFELSNQIFQDEQLNITITNLTGDYFETYFTPLTGFYQVTMRAFDADGRLIDRIVQPHVAFYVHQFMLLKQLFGGRS